MGVCQSPDPTRQRGPVDAQGTFNRSLDFITDRVYRGFQ